jgi:hypothetical protein
MVQRDQVDQQVRLDGLEKGELHLELVHLV